MEHTEKPMQQDTTMVSMPETEYSCLKVKVGRLKAKVVWLKAKVDKLKAEIKELEADKRELLAAAVRDYCVITRLKTERDALLAALKVAETTLNTLPYVKRTADLLHLVRAAIAKAEESS